jgi:hypothetical protein
MKSPHPYSLQSRERVAQLFAIAGVVLALGFGFAVEHLWTPPWWVDTPAVFGFYTLLYLLLDHVAWRWSWISRLLGVPDISGRWIGTVRTSHDNVEKAHPVIVIVRQSWSTLLICLEGKLSYSVSSAAHVFDGPAPETFEVVYSYQNTPRNDAGETLHPHLGTAHLKFSIVDGQHVLDGDYYTGRGRNTHGRIILCREANQRGSLVGSQRGSDAHS